MDIYVAPVSVEEILPLRELHRTEMNCQIVWSYTGRVLVEQPMFTNATGRSPNTSSSGQMKPIGGFTSSHE